MTMITEDSVEQNESPSTTDMINETNVVTTDLSEDTAASEMLLARNHLAHKHYYSLDNDRLNNGNNASQAYIESQTTSLAIEAAVSIIINGIHYAVLMASPYQLEYLAVGFLFSEGLIQHSHEYAINRNFLSQLPTD